MVSVHPVLGNLGREPGAQAVVGVRHRVLVRLELAQLAVAGLEHGVGALLLPRGVERLLLCCVVTWQCSESLRHIPLVLVSLQCQVFLSSFTSIEALQSIFTWALIAINGFSGDVLVNTGTLRIEDEFLTRLEISASSLVVL